MKSNISSRSHNSNVNALDKTGGAGRSSSTSGTIILSSACGRKRLTKHRWLNEHGQHKEHQRVLIMHTSTVTATATTTFTAVVASTKTTTSTPKCAATATTTNMSTALITSTTLTKTALATTTLGRSGGTRKVQQHQ